MLGVLRRSVNDWFPLDPTLVWRYGDFYSFIYQVQIRTGPVGLWEFDV